MTAEPLLVACTQEQRLFLELNDQTEGAARVEERPIRFVNIRETGGWSRDARQATPKIAALIAAAILALGDDGIAAALDDWRARQTAKVPEVPVDPAQ